MCPIHSCSNPYCCCSGHKLFVAKRLVIWWKGSFTHNLYGPNWQINSNVWNIPHKSYKRRWWRKLLSCGEKFTLNEKLSISVEEKGKFWQTLYIIQPSHMIVENAHNFVKLSVYLSSFISWSPNSTDLHLDIYLYLYINILIQET